MDYNGRLGIVIADFPGEGLIQHVITQNSLPATQQILESGYEGNWLVQNLFNFGYYACGAELRSFVAPSDDILVNLFTDNTGAEAIRIKTCNVNTWSD
jgi:hypothetical protein